MHYTEKKTEVCCVCAFKGIKFTTITRKLFLKIMSDLGSVNNGFVWIGRLLTFYLKQ